MSALDKLKKWWPEILFIAAISALVYLGKTDQVTYFRDDWYYAYDGYVAGPSIFHVMFSSDRPARGPFFAIYYFLFGPAPLAYHIAMYTWRLLGAYGALWLFHILWPHQRGVNFFMALLFAVYPGFLWWPQGMEYQPMVASACLQTCSIALTLLALDPSMDGIKKITLWTASILTGLYAILLVDYAIGMEGFRILCIFFVINRGQDNNFSFMQKAAKTIRGSLITLSIPLSFIIWKIFIFKGDRKATDIGFQLNTLMKAPLQTAESWAHNFLYSFLNVSLYSWGVPLMQYIGSLRSNDLRFGILTAIVAASLAITAHRMLLKQSRHEKTPGGLISDKNWGLSPIWLGLGGVVLGLVPVIMANRFVAFQNYSHYALPASLPAVMLVTGLIYLLPWRHMRLALMVLLVGVSTLTHYSLAVSANREKEIIREFWWQVYWRAPMIGKGTTLAVYYPDLNYGDDTDIVWGPANFLYYPNQQPEEKLVRYPLAGTRLDQEGMENILAETNKVSSSSRSHTMFLNYRAVLIMSQPSEASCVHIVDQNWPEVSTSDTLEMSSLFPHSKVERVETGNTTDLIPLDFIFGSEPAHGWCFYYQKAELARQQGDWEAVASLERESSSLQLAPSDPVEWMPFVQAYAYLGQKDKVEELFVEIKKDPFLREQFCENLNRMNSKGFPLNPEMQEFISSSLCKN